MVTSAARCNSQPQMTEATRQKRIIDQLGARGAWVVKIHQTGRSRRGLPDVICCYRGVLLAIEVKQPGASTAAARRIHQAVELAAVRQAGGISLIATSYADVEGFLDDIDAHLASHPTPNWEQRPLPARKVVQL